MCFKVVFLLGPSIYLILVIDRGEITAVTVICGPLLFHLITKLRAKKTMGFQALKCCFYYRVKWHLDLILRRASTTRCATRAARLAAPPRLPSPRTSPCLNRTSTRTPGLTRHPTYCAVRPFVF